MPLAGLLGVLHRDVESEVKPSETTALTANLNAGGIAIGSGYYVISDEGADLGAEGTVWGSARFGLPHKRLLSHSQRCLNANPDRERFLLITPLLHSGPQRRAMPLLLLLPGG